MTREIESLKDADEDAGEVNRRHLLRSFWKSAGGFWGRETRVSWILSGTLVLIVFLNLAASYGMNVWHRIIFDALQIQDSDMSCCWRCFTCRFSREASC